MPSNDHARHDRLLVVRYLDLDDDLLASEVSQARALLASCPDCAALATELQLISDATGRMALPARPRDFRLTPQQAASLRPSGFRRFLESAGTAFRFEFLRPLAGAAVAIGLLLAVVGALPLIGAGSPAVSTGDAAPIAGQPAPGASSGGAVMAAATAAPAPTAAPAVGADSSATSAGPGAAATASIALPVVAPAASAAQPAPVATTETADVSPRATAIQTQLERSPAPSQAPAAFASATGTTTAVGQGETPEPAQTTSPESGSAGAFAAADVDQTAGGIPPLAILGLLLAIVGLLVIFLTFVARRIGSSAG